jgi:POT family proton-dependent oligopeptide transporter
MSEKIENENEKRLSQSQEEVPVTHDEDSSGPEPTEEDWKNLREVSDSLPVAAYLVIIIELCERFTYYGLTGPFQNYIQFPAPESCMYHQIKKFINHQS